MPGEEDISGKGDERFGQADGRVCLEERQPVDVSREGTGDVLQNHEGPGNRVVPKPQINDGRVAVSNSNNDSNSEISRLHVPNHKNGIDKSEIVKPPVVVSRGGTGNGLMLGEGPGDRDKNPPRENAHKNAHKNEKERVERRTFIAGTDPRGGKNSLENHKEAVLAGAKRRAAHKPFKLTNLEKTRTNISKFIEAEASYVQEQSAWCIQTW